MWSRINKNRDSGRRTSGNVNFESPTDQSTVLHATSGNPLTPRSLLKDLPALPREFTLPPSNDRVTSSIYSHDDGGMGPMSGHIPTLPASNNAEYPHYYAEQLVDSEISPPDSPIDLSSPLSLGDISPIDDHSDFLSELPKQRASQLPVSRRNVSNDMPVTVATQSIAGSFSLQAKQTHPRGAEGPSDKYSTSQNITPQDFQSPTPQHGVADARSKEATRLFSAGKEKLQMFAKTREQKQREPKQAREPWKGASGRAPLVPPIDTKSTAKYGKKPAQMQRDTGDPTREYLNTGTNTYTITTITGGPASEERLRSKTGQFRLRSRTASPGKKELPKEAERKADSSVTPVSRTASPVIDVPGIDPVTPQGLRQFSGSKEKPPVLDAPEESNVSDMFQDLSLTPEPRSRFSTSTHAPTEIATTPPGSRDADMPPMPSMEYSPIMTRRRPITTSAASIKSMKRKPVSGDSATTPEVDIKNLSPEEQVQRRVDSLEGRRRQLSLRKESIKTMLHELTEVIQPSSIAYDMATRAEVKKTVSSLKAELDDIGKEDHEIGLKLVRLYKNLSNVSDYEQSSLWVKRITS